MPLYEIKAFMQSVTYEKCWIAVEANSEEEALALAKEDPNSCEFIDSKCLDATENEFVDQDEWEVTLLKDKHA